jgi:hypothetical protein
MNPFRRRPNAASKRASADPGQNIRVAASRPDQVFMSTCYHQYISTYISSGGLSRCAVRRRPAGKNKVGHCIAEKAKSWYESFFGEISVAGAWP